MKKQIQFTKFLAVIDDVGSTKLLHPFDSLGAGRSCDDRFDAKDL
jgi:hypothetical protein